MTAQQRYSQHTSMRTHTAINVARHKKWHVSKIPIYNSGNPLHKKIQRFKFFQVCTSANVQAKLCAQNCNLSSNSEAILPSKFPLSIPVQCLDLYYFSRKGATRGVQAPPRTSDHWSSMRSRQSLELMLPKPQRGITDSFTDWWTVLYPFCTNTIQKFVQIKHEEYSQLKIF
jgi:hypothetical protein